MRRLLLILLFLPQFNAFAQQAAELEVRTVIDAFFAALNSRDTTAMAPLLTPEGVFYAVPLDGRSTAPMAITHAAYLRDLVKGNERLLERYWDPVVRVDEAIATVHTQYDFHVDGRLSHCGTNVFTLVYNGERWAISGGVFTMRRSGCPAGPAGPVDR
jgi:hypothetical protein